MSFDLYFLSRRAGETWDDAMGRLSELVDSDAPFRADEDELWERLKAELQHYLPGHESSEDERYRELSHHATGMQVAMSPGELVLSVPYWYDGDAADQVIELLRQIVAIIENASGLTAYDPQADAPFLGGGDEAAAVSFDRARNVLAAADGPAAQSTQAAADARAAQPTQPKSGWRKLFKR